MNRFARGVAWLLIMGLVGWDTDSAAYDLLTHEALNVGGTLESSTGVRLRDELGFSRGVEETFGGKGVIDWIREGGSLEDNGFRFLNHFHHPLRSPWRDAGLKDITFGESSILWAQTANQEAEESFSWINARQAYLSALVSSMKAKREEEVSRAFRSLGQVMHLVADSSVAAHVRNDAHPFGDPYEKWVEREVKPRTDEATENARRRFLGTFATPPFRPDDSFILKLAILGQDAMDAPVPIARLWDSDRYNGTNPVVTLDGQIGITEYTNANFFSEDTVFADQRPPDHRHFSPFPSSADVESFTDPVKNRKYWRKRGAAAGEPQHLAVVSKRLFWQQSAGVQSPPRGRLDEKVHEDYARLLVPRAVGYSAALLDYFFRGKLNVDLVEDPTDSSRIQLVGTNGATSDELVNGTLTLYSDSPSGMRSQVIDFAPTTLTGVKPGDPLSASPPSFQPPADAERFVAIYEGTLGQEAKDPTRGFPGGVIGKVLGGVRVEEVFSDGVRWRLRTPKGVFLLPLMVAEFEDVRWGDSDNILVTRTPFGRPDPNQPNRNRVVAYEVQRLPGSVELVTVDTPDGPEAQVTKKTEALFPFGMSLGTTVQFSQTIQYRQQLAKFEPRKTVFRFESHPEICATCGFYLFDHVEIGPLQLQTVVEQAIPFSESSLVRLDPERNLDFGTVDRPYLWLLQDVTADATGRLLGVVVVFLLTPESPPVTVPFFGLNQAGAQEVVVQFPVFPFFPPEVSTLLWAVVDLKDQRVVASTADPTIVIASQATAEEPNWAAPSFSSSPLAPVVYAHFFEERVGGPNAGLDDQGWGTLRLAPVSPGTALSVTELQNQQGERAVSAEGWLRTELKEELTQRGLLSFQVDVGTSTTDFRYDCAAENACFGLRVTTSNGFVAKPPVQLDDARRARPAPGGERLVFLARGLTPPVSTILVWDESPPRAQVLQQFQTDVPSLGPATGTTVLGTTLSFDGLQLLFRGFLIPLEGGQGPVVFEGADFRDSFTLLDPSFLYSTQELKFFRSKPPLQRTALPAKLADLPDGSNPAGDYHAIRLP